MAEDEEPVELVLERVMHIWNQLADFGVPDVDRLYNQYLKALNPLPYKVQLDEIVRQWFARERQRVVDVERIRDIVDIDRNALLYERDTARLGRWLILLP
jgi:hypothetical protein